MIDFRRGQPLARRSKVRFDNDLIALGNKVRAHTWLCEDCQSDALGRWRYAAASRLRGRALKRSTQREDRPCCGVGWRKVGRLCFRPASVNFIMALCSRRKLACRDAVTLHMSFPGTKLRSMAVRASFISHRMILPSPSREVKITVGCIPRNRYNQSACSPSSS